MDQPSPFGSLAPPGGIDDGTLPDRIVALLRAAIAQPATPPQLPQRADDAYQQSLDRWGQIGKAAKTLAVGDPNQTRAVPVDENGQPLPISDPQYKDWLVSQGRDAALSAIGGGSLVAKGGALGAAGGALRMPAETLPRIDNPIRAYHGSPHDFNQFDLSKIGTGEGAQAYGHGLYFAENPVVAKEYQDVLTRRVPNSSEISPSITGNSLFDIAEKNGELINGKLPFGPNRSLMTRDQIVSGFEQGTFSPFDLRPSIQRQIIDHIKPPGRMYEVNIHARPEQMLNWDAPLTGQSQPVATALNKLGMVDEPNSFYGEQLYRRLGDKLGGREPTSAALRDAGIPGIKYLDQGSRGLPDINIAKYQQKVESLKASGANPSRINDAEQELQSMLRAQGERTSNYVIFTPEIIDILRKYGITGLTASGAAGSSFGSLAPEGDKQ